MLNYVFLISDQSELDSYYSDLLKRKNVSFIMKSEAFKSKLKSAFFRFSFSQVINNHLPVFWRKLFFKTIIKKIPFAFDENLVIVFQAGWYDRDFVEWLKDKYPKCKRVLYFNDTINCCENAIRRMNHDRFDKEFNLVMCYNIGDAKKYGFVKCNTFLSKKDIVVPEAVTDVSFVGLAKDRQALIEAIYAYLSKNGCKCNFHIVFGQKKNNGIEYANKYMTYEEYLRYELSANCLLEVLKGDTESETLRCWEAVYYNKKLITNWKGILDFKYYNPKYMLYFEKPEDIDIDFIKNDEKVEYNYSGENSPLMMIDRMEELLNK